MDCTEEYSIALVFHHRVPLFQTFSFFGGFFENRSAGNAYTL